MKDYSLVIKKDDNYILSYSIKSGEIIAKLANGEKYIVPYNSEDEKSILAKMEKQAKNASFIPLKRIEKVATFFCLIVVLPLATYNVILNGAIGAGGLALAILATVSYSVKMLSSILAKRDISKLNYFLDNQQALNEDVNINNIDKFTLKDLKRMMTNVEKTESSSLLKNEDNTKVANILIKR